MGRSDSEAVPAICLWAVWAAAGMVPAAERHGWRRTHLSQAGQYYALLRERGESRRVLWARLFAFERQVWRDALRTRFPDWEPAIALRRRARSPWMLLVFTAVFLVLASGVSRGFRSFRTLRTPLPYANAAQLVTCYQVHFASMSLGAQARYVKPWQENSKTLEGLEAYAPRTARVAIPGAAEETAQAIRVTPGFFGLLGVKPALGAGLESAGGEATVLLDWSYWKRRFPADAGVVGRQILLDGRPVRVAGVLPEGFWFRSPQVAVWTLLPSLDKPDPALRLVNTIGRLKPGFTLEQARRELQQIAFSSSRFRGGAFRVVPLQRSLSPSVQIPLLAYLCGTLFAVLVALVQVFRAVRKEGLPLGVTSRYWAYFAAKVAVLLGVVAAAEVEIAAHNTLNLFPSRFLLGLLLDWLSVVVALLLLRWAMLDQSRRCPVCLRRLGVPVTSGSWSSPLLAPASTEMLCDQGHGALTIAESQTPLGEIRQWIAMEDSWRELLVTENKIK